VRARPHRVRTRPAQDLGAAISFVSITAGYFLIAKPAAGSASATIHNTDDNIMSMSPEEHTAAIHALQSDVSEIKGILNNGLRTMVHDQRSELATVKKDIQLIRAHRSRRQGGRRLRNLQANAEHRCDHHQGADRAPPLDHRLPAGQSGRTALSRQPSTFSTAAFGRLFHFLEMTMTVQTILPRGIRNNNPFNIRLSPDNRWQGRLSPRLNSDGAFEQFQDPIMGLRAAAVLLIAHYDRTIRKLVEVWAPPNENDTKSYARCVAEESGFDIDEPLDLHDYACLRPVLTAMIRIENGRQPYTDAQIDAALVRAGVIPPQRSLQQTRTVKGGQVAAAGTIGAGAIGAIQETVGQAHDALIGVVPYLDAAKWGLLAVTLIGIGVASMTERATSC
jgi:hypothetical protein